GGIEDGARRGQWPGAVRGRGGAGGGVCAHARNGRFVVRSECNRTIDVCRDGGAANSGGAVRFMAARPSSDPHRSTRRTALRVKNNRFFEKSSRQPSQRLYSSSMLGRPAAYAYDGFSLKF